MLRSSTWDVDVLLIDLPPGTGDVQLSLAQQVAIDGAVVVTTPQQVAVSDARKAVQMFRKVDIRVFGVLENMSFMTAPDGSKIHPFGQGGGDALAREMSTLFLGEVALEPVLGASVDKGVAPVFPDVFAAVADTLLAQLHTKHAAA